MTSHISAPPPDLRIVPTTSLHPHEEHDPQRARPLIERIRHEAYFLNAPIVAPMDAERFVILDGANRAHAFAALEYPHIMVQVAPYESGLVTLDTWQHIVCAWDADALMEGLARLPEISVIVGQRTDEDLLAQVLLRNGEWFALSKPFTTMHEHMLAQRRLVGLYQQNAILHRTVTTEPGHIWPLFPDGVALIYFPPYHPDEIITAARDRAFLPPGVSRHIVHGRAVSLNYSLDALRDREATLEAKNAALMAWMQQKHATRQVRYYAEATWQFDE